jgi:hypothetical protein
MGKSAAGAGVLGVEPIAGLLMKIAMVFWAEKTRCWSGSGKGGTRFLIDAME